MINRLVAQKERFLKKWYPKILADFNFSREQDLESAKNLRRKLLKNNLLEEIFSKMRDEHIIIFAPGPSLIQSIQKINPIINEVTNKTKIISVDGAYYALKMYGIKPDIIVTDLDGINFWDMKNLSKTVIFLHAHGDNLDKIKEYPPYLIAKTIGTCQVDLNKMIHNIGGFTDGDRAVAICELFQVKTATMVGMDFGFKIGKYSKPFLKSEKPVDATKRKKFLYAMGIIRELIHNSRVKYYTLFERIELREIPVLKIEGFKKIINN
ncbi:MAG: 6-hydroxymethylpterin diphosphokinase MptE-like protein [Candidatus Odinarchaeia archaeon]